MMFLTGSPRPAVRLAAPIDGGSVFFEAGRNNETQTQASSFSVRESGQLQLLPPTQLDPAGDSGGGSRGPRGGGFCGGSHTVSPAPAASPFDGHAYSHKHDHVRLTGQIERIRDLMIDGKWRTFREIRAVTGDESSSISAQLRNLRKEKFGVYTVDKRRRGTPGRGLWEYRVTR